MCQILLSIKPEFVEKIINGTKQYEYRKMRCKNKVEKIIIYSTSPQKMIVAEADVAEFIEDELNAVWEMTKKFSGITYNFFCAYYKGRKKAYAYKLANVQAYNEPKSLSDYGISYAPQSFVYINSVI